LTSADSPEKALQLCFWLRDYRTKRWLINSLNEAPASGAIFDDVDVFGDLRPNASSDRVGLKRFQTENFQSYRMV